MPPLLAVAESKDIYQLGIQVEVVCHLNGQWAFLGGRGGVAVYSS